MNPIGLTIAEEARERRSTAPPVTRGVRPPGVPGCQATTVPDGSACAAEAGYVIVWSDGDRSLVCGDCALRLRLLAESHRTTLRVSRLTTST